MSGDITFAKRIVEISCIHDGQWRYALSTRSAECGWADSRGRLAYCEEMRSISPIKQLFDLAPKRGGPERAVPQSELPPEDRVENDL